MLQKPVLLKTLKKMMKKGDNLAQMQHMAHFRMKMSYVWRIYS